MKTKKQKLKTPPGVWKVFFFKNFFNLLIFFFGNFCEEFPPLFLTFIHGILFLLLTIQFPDTLTPEVQSAIQKLLSPALSTNEFLRVARPWSITR